MYTWFRLYEIYLWNENWNKQIRIQPTRGQHYVWPCQGLPKTHKLCDSVIIFSQNCTNKSHDRTIFPSFGRKLTFWPLSRSWGNFFTSYCFFGFISRINCILRLYFFSWYLCEFIIYYFFICVPSLVISFAFQFRSTPRRTQGETKFVNIKISSFETEVRKPYSLFKMKNFILKTPRQPPKSPRKTYSAAKFSDNNTPGQRPKKKNPPAKQCINLVWTQTRSKQRVNDFINKEQTDSKRFHKRKDS